MPSSPSSIGSHRSRISFGINNVALVDGVPTTLGLLEMCNHYIDHRLDVVVRRTRYRLRRAQERLHIVEGLLIALENIDEVVAIIRSSQDTPEARERLMNARSISARSRPPPSSRCRCDV